MVILKLAEDCFCTPRNFMKRLLLAVFLPALALAACDRKLPPPSPEQQQAILKDAPPIFATEHDHATLRGLDGIFLGQDKKAALAKLRQLCPKTMEYHNGFLGGDATFQGCVFDKPRGPISSIRVGFWPRIGDKVATLEVKRDDIRLDQVRERFRQFAGKLSVDVPHPGMVEMRAQKYQIMADDDQGKNAPVHIAFGYTQKWGDKLEKK